MISVIKNPYKSIQVESKHGIITICEGDKIEFVVENSGEIVKGIVTKFAGKEDKLKLQIFLAEQLCEQIWSITVMTEGSLKLVDDDE